MDNIMFSRRPSAQRKPINQPATYFLTILKRKCLMEFIKGDSGGPLIYKDNTNSWVQIGVVSFGSAKGCLVGPSAFARVTSFLGWISYKIGQGEIYRIPNWDFNTSLPIKLRRYIWKETKLRQSQFRCKIKNCVPAI